MLLGLKGNVTGNDDFVSIRSESLASWPRISSSLAATASMQLRLTLSPSYPSLLEYKFSSFTTCKDIQIANQIQLHGWMSFAVTGNALKLELFQCFFGHWNQKKCLNKKYVFFSNRRFEVLTFQHLKSLLIQSDQI